MVRPRGSFSILTFSRVAPTAARDFLHKRHKVASPSRRRCLSISSGDAYTKPETSCIIPRKTNVLTMMLSPVYPVPWASEDFLQILILSCSHAIVHFGNCFEGFPHFLKHVDVFNNNSGH